MNNCIDERIIPYRRPQQPIKIEKNRVKGTPLTQKTQKEGVIIRAMKAVALIFLLFVSTFGGEVTNQKKSNEGVTLKAVKKCIVYTGIALALWGFLVVVSNLVNAVTLLPLWSLILIFALSVLTASGVMKS
ncbi:MAG: hypothetical protein E7574_04955 [Ruminococcaceae bacterium]|nr:hypothetical protein [Oscillospiraceae bacterium]